VVAAVTAEEMVEEAAAVTAGATGVETAEEAAAPETAEAMAAATGVEMAAEAAGPVLVVAQETAEALAEAAAVGLVPAARAPVVVLQVRASAGSAVPDRAGMAVERAVHRARPARVRAEPQSTP
jgi:hypothetical protein